MSSAASATENRAVNGNTSWFGLIKQTGAEWSDDDAPTWAAAVACYTLLALAPLMVLAIRFLSVFLTGHVPQDQIRAQAQAWMGPTAGNAITEIVNNASRPGSGKMAAIVSIIVAIVSVGGIFAELQQAMNRIWKVKPKPGRAIAAWLWARVMSLGVVIAAALLLLISVVITTWLGDLIAKVGLSSRVGGIAIEIVASLVVLTLLFGLLYRTVPDAQIGWKTIWVGAVIGAVLFELGKYGLAAYFKFAAPSSAYGAVGSLAAVLIWIYYSSMIFFFGAEFTQIYAKARGHGVRPSKHAQSLSKCDETETATPSHLPESEKPQRPAVEGRHPAQPQLRPISDRVIGATNGSHVSSHWVPVITAVSGAVAGAIGLVGLRRMNNPSASDLAAARLNSRLGSVEHKMARVVQFQACLRDKGFNARIARAERRIRAASRKANMPAHRRKSNWLGQIADAIQHLR
jgi:membrane protein